MNTDEIPLSLLFSRLNNQLSQLLLTQEVLLSFVILALSWTLPAMSLRLEGPRTGSSSPEAASQQRRRVISFDLLLMLSSCSLGHCHPPVQQGHLTGPYHLSDTRRKGNIPGLLISQGRWGHRLTSFSLVFDTYHDFKARILVCLFLHLVTSGSSAQAGTQCFWSLRSDFVTVSSFGHLPENHLGNPSTSFHGHLGENIFPSIA